MNRTLAIPTLTDDDKRIIEVAEFQADDWTKNCFQAAFVHLELAHKLADVDPAMAIFRAITAEEEAATGLLRALQFRNYPRAGNLSVRNHLHKAAVFPFILGIVKHTSYLKFSGVESVQLVIPKNEHPPRLKIGLILDGELKGIVAQPEPPLNLKITEGDNNFPPDYRRYILELLDAGGYSEIRKYFEKKANQRNLILYASPKGLTHFSSIPNSYLNHQKRCVMTILKAALLIWPYDEIQPFVTDLIEGFLIATHKVQNETPCIEP